MLVSSSVHSGRPPRGPRGGGAGGPRRRGRAAPGTSAGRPRAGDVDRHVGARIRERRLGLGLSLQEVAKLAGSTYQQQHKYEKGVNRISAGRLHAIARALGPVVAGDAVLCSDGAKAYATFAAG